MEFGEIETVRNLKISIRYKFTCLKNRY